MAQPINKWRYKFANTLLGLLLAGGICCFADTPEKVIGTLVDCYGTAVDSVRVYLKGREENYTYTDSCGRFGLVFTGETGVSWQPNKSRSMHFGKISYYNLLGQLLDTRATKKRISNYVLKKRTLQNANASGNMPKVAQFPLADTIIFQKNGYYTGFVAVNKFEGNYTLKQLDSVYEFYWEVLKKYSLYQPLLPFANPYTYCTIGKLYESVGDVYTQYLDSSSATTFQKLFDRKNVGLGLQLDSTKAGYVVSRIFGEGPGYIAGVRKGDLVVAVNQNPIIGASLDTLYSLLSGNVGEIINLKVIRNEAEYFFDITIGIYSVPTLYCDSLSGEIAKITINDFRPNITANELRNYLPVTPSNIILDMRTCVGGDFQEVLQTAAEILPTGTPFVYANMRNRVADSDSVRTIDSLFRIERGNENFNKKIVVLVDTLTASAAELFTACIRDAYPRTEIVGQHTYGKATGQMVINGPDHGSATITFAQFRSPSGKTWGTTGIIPDVVVPYSEEIINVACQHLNGTLGKRRAEAEYQPRRYVERNAIGNRLLICKFYKDR